VAINGCPAAQSLLPSEERRWQFLWLRSLEFLLILENSGRVVCPRHTGKTNSDLEPLSKRNRRSEDAEDIEVEDYTGFESENGGSVSDSELIPAELPPNTASELAAAAAMRNRRIQTMGCGPDAYYTPLAGLTRLNSKGPFEIVHKDIGYSSDADMSDVGPENGASTAKNNNNENSNAPGNRLTQSNSSDHVNTVGAASSGACSRSSRKRSVRRRRATQQHQRSSVRRPWSFHDGWTDWDYYQPPSYSTIYAHEYKSSENLMTTSTMSSPLDGPPDEHTLRSLTEFGENYEFWFKNEDDAIIRASTPVRSECGDQTYLVAKADPASNTAANELVSNASICSPATSPTPSVSSSEVGVQSEALSTGATTATTTDDLNKHVKQRRSRRSYVLYVTLTMLTLFLSTLLGGGLEPHIQKMYPHRAPPC